MNGVICKTTNQLVYLNNLPEPILQPNSAIVHIRRIGICGTDYHAYRGKQPFFTYPRVLGHELVGEIINVVDNELGFEVGDQVSIIPYFHCGMCQACMKGKTNCCEFMKVFGVHIDGGMKERVVIPITHLVKTNDITLDQSILLEPLAIGAHAIARSGLQPNQTALVIGAGPIGLGIMALINNMGATAIAMDVNHERLISAEAWGKAKFVVNAKYDPVLKLNELFEGSLPSIVFDATGNAQSMMNAFEYTAHGGSLVYVGLFPGDITFHDPDFHRKELTLMGSRNATKQDFEHVLKAIKSGEIVTEHYITHRCRLEHLTGAIDEWLMPESNVIKAVVEVE